MKTTAVVLMKNHVTAEDHLILVAVGTAEETDTEPMGVMVTIVVMMIDVTKGIMLEMEIVKGVARGPAVEDTAQ